MPNLVGNIAEKFRAKTEAALTRAGAAHLRDPFERGNFGDVPTPNLRTPTNVQMNLHMISQTPMARNMGTSANVVINPNIYNQAVRRMDAIDELVGAEIHAALCQIEEMCSTIFQVPETIERIRNVCSEVKRCLGPFRAVTDGIAIDTRKYVHAMSDVDHGNTGQIAISQLGADNAVQAASNALDRQANNMERTSASYKSTSDRLERDAEREQRRADDLQAQIDAIMASM